MSIIAHAGLWDRPEDKNSLSAHKRALEAGFGTEVDIRDHQGKVVISHDPPMGGEPLFEDLLKLFAGGNRLLALNIKSNGIAKQLKELLDKYDYTNYFVFDMSIPELVTYINEGLDVFTGVSDIVPMPAMIAPLKGVWLDSFLISNWWRFNTIKSVLQELDSVCIVSEDLHGRDYEEQWKIIKESGYSLAGNELSICTDKPEEARKFFYEYN